ncbi:hypothetical protein AMTR_s00071p00099180 [Amborella trichopoda]|uniref:Uncharacterized protein n=1 Tax=Amborella trichopoda TaxID=13333 RepID=U5DBM3_AMBTC|nr:hypothetical protein AMTR_s00071p00099180 [Amborella trichopoda]
MDGTKRAPQGTRLLNSFLKKRRKIMLPCCCLDAAFGIDATKGKERKGKERNRKLLLRCTGLASRLTNEYLEAAVALKGHLERF